MITTELESELRRAFARTAAEVVVPEAGRQRLIGRKYRFGRPRRSAAIVGAAVTAAGLAASLAAVTGSPPAAPLQHAFRFDSYSFRMPAAYDHPVSRSACRFLVVEIYGLVRYLPGREVISGVRQPTYGKEMMTAASSAGGCLRVYLEPTYPEGPADPDAPRVAQPVRVGRYHGLFVQRRVFFSQGSRGTAVHREAVSELFVELPLRNGMMRDLAISGAGLSERTLKRIVLSGLSS
jgi:hypothetical protein